MKPGIFKAYAEMWRCALDFDGRTSRRFFVLALLLDFILQLFAEGILKFIDTALLMSDLANTLSAFWYIGRIVFSVFVMLPMYSRRLHDANKKAIGLIIARVAIIFPSILYLFNTVLYSLGILNSPGIDSYFRDIDINIPVVFSYILAAIVIVVVTIANFSYFLDCILFPSVSEGSRFGNYTINDTCGNASCEENQKSPQIFSDQQGLSVINTNINEKQKHSKGALAAMILLCVSFAIFIGALIFAFCVRS